MSNLNGRPHLWKITCTFWIFFCLALFCGLADADSPSAKLLPESSLTLNGDSTLKKFSSKATKMVLEIDPAPKDMSFTNLQSWGVKKFVLKISVVGLKSDSGTLDSHLEDALNSDKYPEILASVKNYQIKEKSSDGSYPVTASLELTIAGTSKVVPVEARVFVTDKQVRIQGEKKLLMTDFDVKPPTLLLGTIKTENEIEIHFDLMVGDPNGF